MNPFLRNKDLPWAFRMRLERQVRRSDKLTDAQRERAIRALDDDAFVAEVGRRTVAKYGAPKGGVLDWLKSLDWMQIIMILLAVLPLFLEEEEPQS